MLLCFSVIVFHSTSENMSNTLSQVKWEIPAPNFHRDELENPLIAFFKSTTEVSCGKLDSLQNTPSLSL